ncbi:acyl-CoA thioesterase-1 [Alicyclobacillus sacchari]|uniref:Acyl-CoA thioesterase-1 n=1 Tax=Alicyclobacillus sacchari TaxID=392010 RepID=A0A4R8LJH5_9BACL|nr:SGNH/GDSL hydrolase family protein [Alicyclobacillus sacchari]TDY42596.1 acyl-CoA thioesterase-1 [Alicyclobacillus sacchari]GMA58143.1 hypothetical protein GCM10025858_26460 [Alicyclobacillus sacchari]
MKIPFRKWALTSGLIAFAILTPMHLVHAAEPVTPEHAPASLPSAPSESNTTVPADADNPQDVRVLVIGSSVARGWKDNPQEGGYLQRAFDAMSVLTPTTYQVIDKAEPGRGVLTIRDSYVDWLDTYQPDFVVIAWGGLDDLAQKTPLPVYDDQIRWQISEALAHHAGVMLVTTPVSKASYTTYRVAQQNLMNSEITVAEGFHSPNVYVFNVFDQMKRYLSAHHESIVPYMGDGWHPNASGHALAAQLLVRDMMSKFPVSSPVFIPSKSAQTTTA